jgi:hypothetical protein
MSTGVREPREIDYKAPQNNSPRLFNPGHADYSKTGTFTYEVLVTFIIP